MNRSFVKISTCNLLVLLLLFITAAPAYSSELTQRDWLVALTDSLGWSFGLPDEPQDSDYINILYGNREFRFEAEDIYDKESDYVSLMSFRNFGDFSGEGWLHGSKEPTDVHLSFNLPIGGQYTVVARVRQADHLFRIGDTVASGGADKFFTDVTVGTFYLDAGPQEIITTLPAGGSIDSIRLAAPNYALIAPENGWDPDADLTWDAINITLIQLLKLADIFPQSGKAIEIEAENFAQPGARIVTTPHLGRVSKGKWMRAGSTETEIMLPLNSIQSGFYNLTLRVLGDPMKVVIGNHHTINFSGKAYLDDYTFPALYFTGSETGIKFTLPPGAGIDQVKLTRNQVEKNNIATLLGLEQRQAPSARDLDTITTLLAAFGVER